MGRGLYVFFHHRMIEQVEYTTLRYSKSFSPLCVHNSNLLSFDWSPSIPDTHCPRRLGIDSCLGMSIFKQSPRISAMVRVQAWAYIITPPSRYTAVGKLLISGEINLRLWRSSHSRMSSLRDEFQGGRYLCWCVVGHHYESVQIALEGRTSSCQRWPAGT